MNALLIMMAIFALIVGLIIYCLEERTPEDKLVHYRFGEYLTHGRALFEAALVWIFGLALLVIGILAP